MCNGAALQHTSAGAIPQVERGEVPKRRGFDAWLAGGNPADCWPEHFGEQPGEAGADWPAAPPAGQHEAGESRDSAAYFTPDGKIVDGAVGPSTDGEGPILSQHLECRAVGCKCWFCPHCCMSKALGLKRRLLPVLRTFKSMMMLTLTVDPKLFPTPEAAFRYVREKRAIAELVRALRKLGHVRSNRFFYVVEWQKQTEMAHFHLLVESDRVPFDVLAKLWGRNRPKDAPAWEGSHEKPLKGQAPEFGHVRFSQGFGNPEHAVHYACKYLNKIPAHGYPSWVLSFRGQIKRFSSSRGLLTTEPPRDDGGSDDPQGEHSPTCFCEACRNGERLDENKCEKPAREQSTVGERLAKCGSMSCVIEVTELVDDRGEVHDVRRFVATVPAPFADVLHVLNFQGRSCRRVVVKPPEVIWLGGAKALIRSAA